VEEERRSGKKEDELLLQLDRGEREQPKERLTFTGFFQKGEEEKNILKKPLERKTLKRKLKGQGLSQPRKKGRANLSSGKKGGAGEELKRRILLRGGREA